LKNNAPLPPQRPASSLIELLLPDEIEISLVHPYAPDAHMCRMIKPQGK